ncbi:MAG: hypothetical protein AAF501_16685, partial [Pseudomonadota bacterium]
SIDTARKFKFRINEICEAGTIPDYHVEIVDPAEVSTPFKTKGKQALVRFQPKFDDLTVPDVPNLSDLTVSHSVLTEIKHANPEYDIQYILDAWREWATRKDDPVKSANAAFRAFAKKYIEANPIW